MRDIRKNRAFRVAVGALIIALAAVLIWKFVKIEPAGKSDKKGYEYDESLPSATLTIDFGIVYEKKNYAKLYDGLKTQGVLPENGYFAEKEALNIEENDNVLDVLLRYCEANDIAVDYETAEQNKYGTAYVKGIGGLYEGDCTKKSGWTYEVNGESPKVGMSDFAVADGDEIEISFVVF